MYGSLAKGNYKNGSDVDIVLIRRDAITIGVLYKVVNDIDDLLLPYTFDISLLKYIQDPDILDHIARVGFPLYEKTDNPSHIC